MKRLNADRGVTNAYVTFNNKGHRQEIVTTGGTPDLDQSNDNKRILTVLLALYEGHSLRRLPF